MKHYTQADQYLHWLCQPIAKVNCSFVPPKEDDSHTNLAYDLLGDRIVGRWIDGPSGKVILGLSLTDFCFHWYNESGKSVASLGTVGKSILTIEEALAKHAKDLGLGNFTVAIGADLHYKVHAYPFAGKEVKFMAKDSLKLWRRYRKHAHQACANLLNHLQVEGEIRIWPHHFDTGIYVAANPEIGIGFGLAMEDSVVGKPYLYMAGYPLKGQEIDYKSAPDLSAGKWITGKDWKGATLSLDRLRGKNFKHIQKTINEFIRQAIAWYLGRD